MGGFDSHLTNPPTLKAITSESSNNLAGSDDHGVMLRPDFAKEIERKLENNSSSTRTQINLDLSSTRIETPLAQPIFGLRNASSTYKQIIRFIYENSLDHFFCVENHSVTAGREAPVFDVYPDPVESYHEFTTAWISSPMRWQKFNSSPARIIHLQNYSTTFEKLSALMIFRFNTLLPL